MATGARQQNGITQFIAGERAALPLRFDFANWGWKWLYLLALIVDAGLLIGLMARGSQPLPEALANVPWVLWWFSMIGAMIVLTGILIWEEAPLHYSNRVVSLGVFYVVGSVWLLIYLVTCGKPPRRLPIREFANARWLAAITAAVMLALTISTAISSPLAAMFANFRQYPGNIYYVFDVLFLNIFSVPLLWADARRRGVAAPLGYAALLVLLGPFGYWLWFWRRPALVD